MLIVMESGSTAAQIDSVAQRVRELGYSAHVIAGGSRTLVGVSGPNGALDHGRLGLLPGVAQVIPVPGPFRLTARGAATRDQPIVAAGVAIGGGFTVIAGPCSIEDEPGTLRIATYLREKGVKLMRGGAFKPRTSPYSFQGLGVEGLAILERVRSETGIGVVTEVLDVENVARVEEVADVIQVGARSMHNYPLLQRLGRTRRPILLKRGMAATIEEWLMAAEYVMSAGNLDVILCERGVRSFADQTRNLLDLSAVPIVKHLSHLPILVDPSHGTGDARCVPAMSLAALAAGADGLLVEVHPAPERALSDGQQALDFDQFAELASKLRIVAAAMGTTVD